MWLGSRSGPSTGLLHGVLKLALHQFFRHVFPFLKCWWENCSWSDSCSDTFAFICDQRRSVCLCSESHSTAIKKRGESRRDRRTKTCSQLWKPQQSGRGQMINGAAALLFSHIFCLLFVQFYSIINNCVSTQRPTLTPLTACHVTERKTQLVHFRAIKLWAARVKLQCDMFRLLTTHC